MEYFIVSSLVLSGLSVEIDAVYVTLVHEMKPEFEVIDRNKCLDKHYKI